MEYSEQDSICLFNGLEAAQDHYLKSYNVDIGSIWSTSTLSLKIFRTNYLEETIPSLTGQVDNFVRESYYGGATDYYKKYGQNLWYYDVNSLYPYVMLKDMPLKPLTFHTDLSDFKLDDFFGFCLAEIYCPPSLADKGMC